MCPRSGRLFVLECIQAGERTALRQAEVQQASRIKQGARVGVPSRHSAGDSNHRKFCLSSLSAPYQGSAAVGRYWPVISGAVGCSKISCGGSAFGSCAEQRLPQEVMQAAHVLPEEPSPRSSAWNETAA